MLSLVNIEFFTSEIGATPWISRWPVFGYGTVVLRLIQVAGFFLCVGAGG